jgi:hypothetical protein
MNLSELKLILNTLDSVEFVLQDGEQVPNHFHVTEVGVINKRFIDCGGTQRSESVINFQLWTAEDYDHRLSAHKLKSIVELSERTLGLEDLEIEVEYQRDTIGKFKLEFSGSSFVLVSTQTDCLAKDNCGIPASKPKVKLSEMNSAEGSCAPGSGCC